METGSRVLAIMAVRFAIARDSNWDAISEGLARSRSTKAAALVLIASARHSHNRAQRRLISGDSCFCLFAASSSLVRLRK